ncbi:MAG: efflux RND transporter permease subunit, partial [Pseudoalteromonas sp.]
MSPHQPPQLPSNNNPLHGIINWFANNSVAANLLLVSVIVMGIMSLTTLRKEAFPSLEPDTISVSVVYDSGDALQAEEGIALKIEEALETVSGIKRITSTSDA